VDIEGLGWHYDKQRGHKVDDPASPFGQQFGILIVPKGMADEAIAAFPGVVIKLTPPQVEVFYNNFAHAHEPEQEIDTDILNVIKVHRDLGLPDEPWMTAALDSTNRAHGIRKNNRRFFSDYALEVGVNIVQ